MDESIFTNLLDTLNSLSANLDRGGATTFTHARPEGDCNIDPQGLRTSYRYDDGVGIEDGLIKYRGGLIRPSFGALNRMASSLELAGCSYTPSYDSDGWPVTLERRLSKAHRYRFYPSSRPTTFIYFSKANPSDTPVDGYDPVSNQTVGGQEELSTSWTYDKELQTDGPAEVWTPCDLPFGLDVQQDCEVAASDGSCELPSRQHHRGEDVRLRHRDLHARQAWKSPRGESEGSFDNGHFRLQK